MNAKQRAAEAAIPFIQSGMTVGLGTGSTAEYFIDALGAAFAVGKLRDLRCVPTSVASENQARQLGLPLVTWDSVTQIDVTVDGADEIAPNLDLIKGLGGALLREKIVGRIPGNWSLLLIHPNGFRNWGPARRCRWRWREYGHEVQVPFFKGLGADPVLRKDADGKPFVTDNGNFIYDCRFARGMDDPKGLAEKFGGRAGVVETGLFLGIAAVAIVADDNKVRDHAEVKAVALNVPPPGGLILWRGTSIGARLIPELHPNRHSHLLPWSFGGD